MADTIIPESLLRRIEDAAKSESRTPSDVVEEAMQIYFRQKKLAKHYAYGEQKTRETGLTEADIPRLIREVREGKTR